MCCPYLEAANRVGTLLCLLLPMVSLGRALTHRRQLFLWYPGEQQEGNWWRCVHDAVCSTGNRWAVTMISKTKGPPEHAEYSMSNPGGKAQREPTDSQGGGLK